MILEGTLHGWQAHQTIVEIAKVHVIFRSEAHIVLVAHVRVAEGVGPAANKA